MSQPLLSDEIAAEVVTLLRDATSSSARRAIEDRKVLREEQHPSSHILANITLVDGEWRSNVNPDDFETITSYTVTLPETTNPKCGYKPGQELNLFEELNRVAEFRVRGGLVPRETRAKLDHNGQHVAGTPRDAEKIDALSLRKHRGRVILRGATSVGGRRYQIDPAYPTSNEIDGPTVVRITQHGANETQVRGPYTGDHEWVPAGCELYPTITEKLKNGEPGMWVAMKSRPVRTKTKTGASYGETIEYDEDHIRPPLPQWDRPYQGPR